MASVKDISDGEAEADVQEKFEVIIGTLSDLDESSVEQCEMLIDQFEPHITRGVSYSY